MFGLEAKVLWLFVFVALYWSYCIYWGIKGAKQSRQWMIGKKFGFLTPGDMFSNYFRSDTIRILVVLVALVFSVPYLGIQLRASGFLFNVLTDHMFDVTTGMILLSLVVILYVASGGLRAVAYVDTMQCILLAGGIIVLGIITLRYLGGFNNLIEGIAVLSQADT